MMNPFLVAAARTQALTVSVPLAQALANALTHFAAWSKQLDALKPHLFEGQPYNSTQQWFGVNVRTPLILEEQEERMLHILLSEAATTGVRAQALLARLESQVSSNG